MTKNEYLGSCRYFRVVRVFYSDLRGVACHQVVSRAAVRSTELNLNIGLKTSDLGTGTKPPGSDP